MPKTTSDDLKEAILYASIDGMINDALDTIKDEILKFRTKVKQGQRLTPMEAKTLQGYVKCLVDLSKEDRERAKDADLSSMSMEDLVAHLTGKAAAKPQLGSGSVK